MNRFSPEQGLIYNMNIPVNKQALETLLLDEHLSDWFKDALKSALKKDPFEVELEAELLYNVLKARSSGIVEGVLIE
ncbi:MAG: hypothetical protein JNL74_20880 [Fibrobacteres bacterium]|nr:hypothetical protein [Fibrobacterota bacterium]